MYENLLVMVEQAAAPRPEVGSALPEALRISGIALLAIFFVMGLFGAMITLLSVVFPATGDELD